MRLSGGQAALAAIVWILLAALGGLAAWYLLAAILSVASWMIESPTWRPYGWFQGTLAAVNRFATLVLGAGWLVLVMFMEYDLRRAMSEKRFGRRSAWYAGFFLVTVLLSFGITGALA